MVGQKWRKPYWTIYLTKLRSTNTNGQRGMTILTSFLAANCLTMWASPRSMVKQSWWYSTPCSSPPNSLNGGVSRHWLWPRTLASLGLQITQKLVTPPSVFVSRWQSSLRGKNSRKGSMRNGDSSEAGKLSSEQSGTWRSRGRDLSHTLGLRGKV